MTLRIAALFVVAAAWMLTRSDGAKKSIASEGVTIDRARRELRFTAIVQPDAMTRAFGVKGHHAIVWTKGRAARWALFRSDAGDREIRAGLVALGARAGENLTLDTWNARDNPRSSEPDKRVEGTSIEVLVSWPNSAPRALHRFIQQKAAESPELDFRFGGNQKWQSEFHSGCIVCLYSCPGGAIGNRSRTIRDYTREGVIYSSAKRLLPPAGTRVTIHLRPKQEAS